ncbi:MAG: hypothetical protein IKH58_14670 [Bacteroidales bacterium]|nr:hypothetical protein [Bacteroidales bacterium]
MKKFFLYLLAGFTAIQTATAQEYTYNIISESDTVVKTAIDGFVIDSRRVRRFVYEYESKDADGKPATISGIILIPSNIIDGEDPCDGVMLFNRATLSGPDQAPSVGDDGITNALVANPLNPNYIVVASDFIGYGSAIEYPMFYHSGDVNARNSLDGLLAARQLLDDRGISQGKYLFNLGFSQGGSESLYVAKLRDMEYKDKGVTFTKTFAGGGPTDYVRAYREYVTKDWCEDVKDVVMMLTSSIVNLHIDIKFSDIFKEPLASAIPDLVARKEKAVFNEVGIGMRDSLSNLIQPAYMDLNSPEAKAFMDKLQEINLMNGWEPDVTQQYFIEHSRHDNFVPVQSVRAIIPWMKEKGFQQSLVPGKTNLQTNMMVFKADHTVSAIIWVLQTVAAIQMWPVIYYDGEQNRYYHEVVHDMNLMKVIKYLESWGIDLRKLTSGEPLFAKNLREGIEDGELDGDGSVRQLAKQADFFEILNQVSDVLAKVDLTLTDALEMLDDSGITLLDIMEVVSYIQSSPSPESEAAPMLMSEKEDTPLFLLNYYEQTLATWFMLAGFNVQYETWGW